MTRTIHPRRTTPPAETEAFSWIRFGRLLALLLGAFLLLNAALLAAYFPNYITTRRDLTYPEGAVAWGAWKAASGQPVYEDWRQWPHYFAPYGPALYYGVGWTARLMGQPDRFGMSYYLLGRAQSLMYLAGIVAVACLLARRAGCRWGPALSCGIGLFALYPALIGHCVSYRPDAPMVFWNLLAVWLALGGLGRARNCWAVVGCLWMAAAYKHAGWAAPLVVGFCAWRGLGPRKAARWGLLYLGGGLAMALLLNGAMQGRLKLNLLDAMFCGVAMPPFLAALKDANPIDYYDFFARLLALPAVGILLLRRREESPARRGLGIYFMLAPAVAAVQLIKTGSDINYLLESFALVGVAAAVLYQRWMTPGESLRRPAGRWLWAGACLLVALPCYFTLSSNARALIQRKEYTMGGIFERLADTPTPALLMDNAFIHPDPAAHALMDPVYYCVMINQGQLTPEALLERLERREIRWIVLSPVTRAWLFEILKDKRVRAAIERNYAPTLNFHVLSAWKPKE